MTSLHTHIECTCLYSRLLESRVVVLYVRDCTTADLSDFNINVSINITLATRMATVGHIEEFNPEKERTSAYVERVELFFVANNVEDGKQIATLLSLIGSKTYALLSDLLAPDKPVSKSLKQLKKTLQTHFKPKPVVIAERFKGTKRLANLWQNMKLKLRRLSANCKFGDHLTQAIRDRLVCGLRSKGTQKRLLAEADLNLAKALEITQSMEAADRNTQHLKGSTEPQ